jgi:polyene glycosyltransferase
MVVDRFSLAGLHVAQSLGVPVIINSPHLLLLMDQPPLYIPTPFSFLDHYPHTLVERVMNLYYRFRYRLDLIQAQTSIARMEVELTNFSSYQPFNIDYSSAIVLVNTVFGMEYPRPLDPRFKLTGPLLDTPDPLGARLQEWLDSALQSEIGVIYVNLGEDVNLEPHEVQSLLEGLTVGRQRILWSMPKLKRFLLPKVLPASVRWNSFVPQMSVLAHDAVKIFVTHCGLTGVQEALIHGTPILALPSFVDQWEVALRVVQQQAGVVLDRRDLTPQKVNLLVLELLENASYTLKAEELAAVLAQAGGAKEAIRVIDLTYRVGNSYLLSYQETSFNWIQDNFLDVKAVYCFVLATLGYLLSLCWSALLGLWEANPEPSRSAATLSTS